MKRIALQIIVRLLWFIYGPILYIQQAIGLRVHETAHGIAYELLGVDYTYSRGIESSENSEYDRYVAGFDHEEIGYWRKFIASFAPLAFNSIIAILLFAVVFTFSSPTIETLTQLPPLEPTTVAIWLTQWSIIIVGFAVGATAFPHHADTSGPMSYGIEAITTIPTILRLVIFIILTATIYAITQPLQGGFHFLDLISLPILAYTAYFTLNYARTTFDKHSLSEHASNLVHWFKTTSLISFIITAPLIIPLFIFATTIRQLQTVNPAIAMYLYVTTQIGYTYALFIATQRYLPHASTILPL